MSSSDEYYIKILNDTNVYIQRYLLLVVYIVSYLGNLLSALIFFRRHWRKNVCVFYFKICLLCNFCYINSSVLGMIFNRGFNIHLQDSSVVLCKVYFYVSFVFATLSPAVLILASFDRLLISSQNVDTRLYSSKRLAYFSISLATVFWLVFNVHVLVKVNLQEFYPSYFVCYYDSAQWYLNFISYSSAVINFILCFTMIVLSLFALKNVRRIRAVPRSKRVQIRAMTTKDFQLLRCLFAQGVVYIIFGALVNTDYLYEAITAERTRPPLEKAIDTFLHNVITFLYNASYATSFFIFVFVSRAFRNQLKQLICGLCGQQPLVMAREEQQQENAVNIVVPLA